jgi:hypothetical protein
MAENIQQHLERLKSKMLQLQKTHLAIRKENEMLKAKVAASQEEGAQMQDRIRILQEQQFILKASSGKMGELDKKQFEQSINKYLREIDKCITLLSE